MRCTPVQLPGGGHAIVCGSRRQPQPKPCVVCGKPAGFLCDGPPGGPSEGGTCDAPLCERCRSVQPDGQDWCPDCQAAADAPPQNACGGQWCAFVEAGAHVAARRARLAICPPHLRAEVEAHVRTVFALKRRAAERRASKETSHV